MADLRQRKTDIGVNGHKCDFSRHKQLSPYSNGALKKWKLQLFRYILGGQPSCVRVNLFFLVNYCGAFSYEYHKRILILNFFGTFPF
jgi:hypothetical protein